MVLLPEQVAYVSALSHSDPSAYEKIDSQPTTYINPSSTKLFELGDDRTHARDVVGGSETILSKYAWNAIVDLHLQYHAGCSFTPLQGMTDIRCIK